tara:strand:+ start:501 stop:848 length:348 start_codon:yes stop_codon:yes gene_type:complete
VYGDSGGLIENHVLTRIYEHFGLRVFDALIGDGTADPEPLAFTNRGALLEEEARVIQIDDMKTGRTGPRESRDAGGDKTIEPDSVISRIYDEIPPGLIVRFVLFHSRIILMNQVC